MPQIQEVTVDDVIADGLDLGKSPQEIAGAVHKWRDLTQEWAATAHGDADARRYSEGTDKLDEVTAGALGNLRSLATQGWFQTTFENQPDHANDFLASYEVNRGWEQPQALGGYAGQADELTKLTTDPVWQLPKRRRDWLPIKEPGGNELGTFQILPRGQGLDILLNYKAGEETKHARLNVPPVTDEDITKDIAKTQEELARTRAQIERGRALAEMPAAAFAGESGPPQSDIILQAVREAEFKAQRQTVRLQTLGSAQARDFLTSERVVAAVKESPVSKEIGQSALGEDFVRGVAGFYGNTRVAWNDITGDTTERDEWIQNMSRLKEILPGSTRARLNGGVAGFVSDATEGLGGMAPQLATMAATGVVGLGAKMVGPTVMSTALQTGGGALMTSSLGQMGVSAYGANITDALQRADALEAEADKLSIEFPDAAGEMRAQAIEIRKTYQLTSALKAGSEIVSELILPEELMFIKGGKGSYAKRLATATGKSAAEGAVAELGNQKINALAYGEPGSLLELLRAAALEATAGAPMTVLGSLKGRPGESTTPPSPAVPASPTSSDPNSMAAIAQRGGRETVTWAPAGRQPILTNVPDGAPTLPIPESQTPSKETLRPGPVQTVPETQATLQEQLNRTAEGLKPATFIPDQAAESPARGITVPDGLVSTPVTSPEPGVMVHRPDMDPVTVQQASQEAPGNLMGMGIPTKPADADRAIVLRRADGTPVLDVASNAETETQVREALQKMAKEGDTITVEAPEGILQERQGQERTAPRVGEIVTHEGYTGRLVQDGARFALQTPEGATVEVPSLSGLTRNTDIKAAQAQGLAELQKQSETVEVKDATFQAAPDGTLTIQDGAGNTYVPHNPQLLRTVRTGPNGLEVLVRNPKNPGQVLKLTGAQAQSAQDAFLKAAENVEAKGGKVNWGTAPKPRFQFSSGVKPLDFLTNLAKAIAGKLPANAILDLGMPGPTLLAAGVPNLPLRVRQSTVRRKRSKHPELTQEALASLPAALQNPMLVYVSPGDQKANVIVTTLQTSNGPITAYFTVREHSGTAVLEAKTVFGKDTAMLLAELRQAQASGTITHANKSAFDSWLAQGDGPVRNEASIQLSQAVEGLKEFFAQFSAPDKSQLPTLAQTIKGGVKALQKAANEAVRILNSHLPGLVSEKVRIFNTVQEFLESGQLDPAKLTPEELAQIQSAEGFLDRVTGHTIVIAENVQVRPGETPRSAIARVVIHERIGHEGINTLLATDPEFAKRWNDLSAQIPQAALDAIATQEGYQNIAGDRAQLALEWFARQTEVNLDAPLVKRMWKALTDWLRKAYAGFPKRTAFETDLQDLISQARQAALNGTSIPTSREALANRLQFSINPLHRQGQPFRVNAKMLGTRALLTGSQLPSVLRDILATTNNQKASLDSAFARVGSMMDVAREATAERLNLPVEQVSQAMNDVLDGVPGAMPTLLAMDEGLAEAVRRARNMLDDMQNAIAHTLPVGELRNTIVGNLGHWMRRSYAAFDASANWNYDSLRKAAEEGKPHAGQDARALMQAAASYIIANDPTRKGQKDANGLPKRGSELEADFYDLLNRDTWATALIPDKNTVRKNTTSLIRRRDISPQIRALLGEHTNPLTRFAASGSFQLQFIARHQGQVAMRQAGLAANLFQPQRGGEYNVQIPDDNPAWSGLGGLYTTRELWNALSSTQGVDPMGTGDIGGPVWKIIKSLTANAKLNLVALNPRATVVNMLGGLISSIQAGDVIAPRFVTGLADAWAVTSNPRATRADVTNGAALAVRDLEDQRRTFLISSGLLNSNVTLKEIESGSPQALLKLLEGEGNQNAANRALGAAHGAAIGNAFGRVAGPLGQGVGIAAGATAGAVVGGKRIVEFHQRIANFLLSRPDNIWKVAAYFSNEQTALQAGMLPAEASQWAVERVRNTYPTYDRVPHFLRELSRTPLVGSFISFSYEVPRNAYWNLRYAREDMASGNPALIASGVRRVAGAGAVAALSWWGVGAAGLASLLGWAEPEEEKEQIFKRWLAADYEEGKSLIFTKWDNEGVTYFNQAYIVPQTALAEIAKAVVESKSPDEAITNFVGHTAAYFGFGQNLLTTVGESWMNKDRFGRKVTSKDGLAGVLKRGDHIAETYTDPGYAKVTAALVKAYNAGDEEAVSNIASSLFAARKRKLPWDRAVANGYYKLRDEWQAIRDQSAEQVRDTHLLTDRKAIVDQANQRLEALNQKRAQFEADMQRLKLPGSILSEARKSVPKTFSPIEIDPTNPKKIRSKK